MKKYLIALILSFTLGLLLASSMVVAKQTTMSTYYPSSSGAYTKVLLMNGANGPNENACFCAQNTLNSTGYNLNPNGSPNSKWTLLGYGGTLCDTGEQTAGPGAVTYTNTGTIFSDPNSGYMEICKSDGSAASYVGACFNRFCTGAGCYNAAGACPNHYTAVKNQNSPFPSVTASPVFSYSCCFYNGTTDASHYAQSGCFSIFSSGNNIPGACYSIDPNAYDIGCQTVKNNCSEVRTCCFNSGPNALGFVSSVGCPAITGNGTNWMPPSPCCAPTCDQPCNSTQVDACGNIQACTVPAPIPPCIPGDTCYNHSCCANCGVGSDDPNHVSSIPAANCGSMSVGACMAGYTNNSPTYQCMNGSFNLISGSCTCSSGVACLGGTVCCASSLDECNASTGVCCLPTTCSSLGDNCGTPPDGCGYALNCGGCPAMGDPVNWTTCSSNKCVCTPNCSGKNCGTDGCTGSCGSCPPVGSPTLTTCNGSGVCVCTPNCSGKNCGSDGCGGSCGSCPPVGSPTLTTCNGSGVCVCTPNCSGKNCGSDGCGGSCGTCSGSGACCTSSNTCSTLDACSVCGGNGSTCCNAGNCSGGSICFSDTCCMSYSTTFNAPTCTSTCTGTLSSPCITQCNVPASVCTSACATVTGASLWDNTTGQSGSCDGAGDLCLVIFNGACSPSCPGGCTDGSSTGNCGQTCGASCFGQCCGGSSGYCCDGECCGAGGCCDVDSICLAGVCKPIVCFVPGTKILLANGSSKDVQNLKAGDVLLGSKGSHNRVVKLAVMPKADRKIYAFNGGRYFVTEAHPFMTKDGWKAIDPQAAHQVNPQLKIGQLDIGDELVTRHGLIRLKKIESKTVKNAVVYSPVLDGSEDYYADGYLVHNKPPVIPP